MGTAGEELNVEHSTRGDCPGPFRMSCVEQFLQGQTVFPEDTDSETFSFTHLNLELTKCVFIVKGAKKIRR